jgi:hypothetical protein
VQVIEDLQRDDMVNPILIGGQIGCPGKRRSLEVLARLLSL